VLPYHFLNWMKS